MWHHNNTKINLNYYSVVNSTCGAKLYKMAQTKQIMITTKGKSVNNPPMQNH